MTGLLIATLSVSTLNLIAGGTVALIALKSIKRVDEEVEMVKENVNESITHVQDALESLKF